MVKKLGESASDASEFVWQLVDMNLVDGSEQFVNLVFVRVIYLHDGPHFETCQDCGHQHMIETGIPTRTDAEAESYIWQPDPMMGQMAVCLPIALANTYELGAQYFFVASQMEPLGNRPGAEPHPEGD